MNKDFPWPSSFLAVKTPLNIPVTLPSSFLNTPVTFPSQYSRSFAETFKNAFAPVDLYPFN